MEDETNVTTELTDEQKVFQQIASEQRDFYLSNKATVAIQEAATLYGDIRAWQNAAKDFSNSLLMANTKITELETEIKRLRRRLGPDPKRGRPRKPAPTQASETNGATAPAAGGADANPLNGEDQDIDPVSADDGANDGDLPVGSSEG